MSRKILFSLIFGLCICVLSYEWQLRELRARSAQYTAAIVECANGRSFTIGHRILTCMVTETQ